MRVAVSPRIIRWAIERSAVDYETLLHRFPQLAEWEAGISNPTVKQLENFCKAVYVPVGYMFLPEPPEERLPIPDFRTFNNNEISKPTANLLETVYSCQERQAWYREYARIVHQSERHFIGTVTTSMRPEIAADSIRKAIGFSFDLRSQSRTWEDALRLLIQCVDDAGILVMVSGVVLNNNKRKLNVSEFRGFALSDQFAPLIFINGCDSKSAQMFTIAHELAHLWLNSTGISNASVAPLNGHRPEEVWCNAVAAELLVPLELLRRNLQYAERIEEAKIRLSRLFKVSTLVILRRLFDIGRIEREEFNVLWLDEINRLREIAENASSGGNFYRTTISRVSKRLTRAIVASTLEGNTLYRDAYRMLGIKKTETFTNIGREVGVIL